MEIEKEVIDCVNALVKKVVNRESCRKYRGNNREKVKEYQLQNRQKLNEIKRKYSKTSNGRKSSRINQWKRQGIITDDYDALYNHYLKTAYCDVCRVELTYDRHPTPTTKVVDHDHKIRDAPNFRNILCNSCNVKRRY